MTAANRRIPVVVALVLATAGLLLLVRGGPRPGPAAPPAETSPAATAADDAVLPATARADGEGRFAMEGLPPDGLLLLARASGWHTPVAGAAGRIGYNPGAIDLDPGERREVTVRVEPAGAIAGRVLLPDGTPAAGAGVEIAPPDDDPPPARDLPRLSTTAGEDGRFLLTPLLPGVPCRVRAWAEGFPTRYTGELSPTADRPLDLELSLAKPHWLEVLVRAAGSGAPIAGATVRLRRLEYETDANGFVRAGPFSAEPHWIRVEHPACLERFESDLSGDEPSPLVVDLRRGHPVRGRVLLPDGTPAPTGDVAAIAVPPTKTPSDWRGPIGADGSFSLDGFDEGRATVSADVEVDDRKYTGSATFEVGSGEVTVRLTELVPDPNSRRDPLRIVGPDGEIVATVLYQLVDLGSDWYHAYEHYDPDSEVRVRPGVDVVHVAVRSARAADGRRLAPRIVGPLPANGGPHVVRLTPAARISGTVVDPDGHPVSGALVVANDDGFVEDGWRIGLEPIDRTWTDGDGRFVLDGIGDRPVSLDVDAGDAFLPPRASATPGETGVVLRLLLGREFVLTAVDENDRPISGFCLLVRDDGRGAATGTTDATGRVVLRGLDPRRIYELHGWFEDDRQTAYRPDFVDDEEWTPADATFEFDSTRVVEGTARDLVGLPLPGVDVFFEDAEGETVDSAETDADGRFRIEDLPRRALFATLSVGESDARRSLPPEGKLLDLRVDPGPELRLRIEDWKEEYKDGRIRPDVLVTRSDGSRGFRRARVWDGRLRIFGLDPEKAWTVWAPLGADRVLYVTGLRPSSGEIAIRTSATAPITVELPVGVQWGEVELSGPGFWIGGEKRIGTRFDLVGAPPGTFTLRATWKAGGRDHEATRRVSAGDRITIEE